jgi:hypothetical protein
MFSPLLEEELEGELEEPEELEKLEELEELEELELDPQQQRRYCSSVMKTG